MSMQIRGNPKVNLRLNLWIATPFFAKTARNDRQRKHTLLFRNDGRFCHFERSLGNLALFLGNLGKFVILSELCERKIHRNLRYILNLWILRCAQYDKTSQYDKD